MSAALKSLEVVENLSQVIAIELMCACQGLEFTSHKTFGTGVAIAYKTVRDAIPKLERDRPTYRDIEKVHALIVAETVNDAVEFEADRLDVF